MIFSGIPRVGLLDGPTPLQRLHRIEALTRHDCLTVKRDDAMSLGLGGNKVRSLEFWLGDARAKGADVLLAAGNPRSNMCRLTAAAAAKLGFHCLILHNDHEPERDEGNLLLSRLFGAEFRFLGPIDEEARAQKVAEAAADLRAQGRNPYIVGDSVVGALGYVAAALELHQQAFEQGLDLRHILLSGSMGTTEAGFLFGCALLGGPFQVHLISVEFEPAELEARVAAIYAGIEERLALGSGVNYREWTHFDGRYLGAGYECPTPDSLSAIRCFASREGLLLENTYTSKPAAALLDLVTKGELPSDKGVCLLHTGGLPALFGQGPLFAVSGPE